MTKDEALKLALEAMTYADACLKKQLTTKDKHQYAQDLLLEAGTAIREALAQPEHSCVACEGNPKGNNNPCAVCGMAQPEQEPFGYFRYDLRLDAWVQNREGQRPGTPFYTTPPQRKPLTEKRIEELYSFWVVDCQDIVGFARAIERTVKGEV